MFAARPGKNLDTFRFLLHGLKTSVCPDYKCLFVLLLLLLKASKIKHFPIKYAKNILIYKTDNRKTLNPS